MNKRSVAWLLAVHALVVWLAVPFRIDEFRLTWAPMYAIQPAEAPERRSVVLKDRERLEREGWRAVRADGGEEWVRRADLNVAPRNMWRLYYERSWGHPPPRFKHKNSGGATLDRWWLGIAPGEPIFVENWERALLVSVNETLGRAPGAPDFIVELHAERVRMHFSSETLERLPDTRETARLRWRTEWNAGSAR
ncbi:MAG: hypothetical protein FJ091_08570 [Deltaproteobacteria bacterium]|nr:hypothetical protein [Deltaproteobacteria bacterium]